jgi:hypothetical protein
MTGNIYDIVVFSELLRAYLKKSIIFMAGILQSSLFPTTANRPALGHIQFGIIKIITVGE